MIVGFCWRPENHHIAFRGARGSTAFRWESGQVTLLKSLNGYSHSITSGVSGDGRRIVGQCIRHKEGSRYESGFLWDADHGMRSIKETLARAGAISRGWEILRAFQISRDGSTIIGVGYNPQSQAQVWVARLLSEIFEKPKDPPKNQERE